MYRQEASGLFSRAVCLMNNFLSRKTVLSSEVEFWQFFRLRFIHHCQGARTAGLQWSSELSFAGIWQILRTLAAWSTVVPLASDESAPAPKYNNLRTQCGNDGNGTIHYSTIYALPNVSWLCLHQGDHHLTTVRAPDAAKHKRSLSCRQDIIVTSYFVAIPLQVLSCYTSLALKVSWRIRPTGSPLALIEENGKSTEQGLVWLVTSVTIQQEHHV